MQSHATNYYRSKASAIKYHELFGFSREQAKAMLADGIIRVGQPPLAAGETLIHLEGGRYAVAVSLDPPFEKDARRFCLCKRTGGAKRDADAIRVIIRNDEVNRPSRAGSND